MGTALDPPSCGPLGRPEPTVPWEPTGTSASGAKDRLAHWKARALGWTHTHKRHSPDHPGYPLSLGGQETGPNYILPWEITMRRPAAGPL